MRLVVAVVLLAIAAFSFAADDRVELKKGYEAGQLELTFTAKDNGARMEVKVKNLTATPLTVLVNKGETRFDFTYHSVGLSSASERALKLPASGDAAIVVEQSGQGRMTTGSMTTSKKASKP